MWIELESSILLMPVNSNMKILINTYKRKSILQRNVLNIFLVLKQLPTKSLLTQRLNLFEIKLD